MIRTIRIRLDILKLANALSVGGTLAALALAFTALVSL